MEIRAKAVIFDLDGVLADSTQAVERSWEAWSRKHGFDPQRSIEIGHGRTTIEAIRVIAPQLDADAAFEEMEALEASFIGSVVPVNGAPQTVAYLSENGIPWAVATSSSRRTALPRLLRAGIPRPAALVTADDVTLGKPDPEPYAKAAGAVGFAPWECIVFEDAPAGMLAARRAGARVIAIGPQSGAPFADAAARDFVDLDMAVENASVAFLPWPSLYRCACCRAHTLPSQHAREICVLCRWPAAGDDAYSLAEARENVHRHGVMYRPHDARFAIVRHPILGARGEYAVDRTLLRERALLEFRAFGEHAADRAKPSPRLRALLACIEQADALYVKR